MKLETPSDEDSASIAPVSASAHPGSEKNFKYSLEAGNPGRAVVLHCEGQIVFQNEARALSTIVSETLPEAGRMVVDLAGIDTFNSSVLGELVLTQLWADAAGYVLKFASSGRSVRELFEVTHVAALLDVHDSVPEAIAAIVREEIPSVSSPLG